MFARVALYYFRLLFFIGLLSIGACEYPADIELPMQRTTTTVLSNFKPAEPLTIEVSTIGGIADSTKIEYPSDASIKVFTGEDFIETLTFFSNTLEKNAYYQSLDLIPEEGKEYSIRVEVEGVEAVESSSIIPIAVPIHSVIVRDVEKSINPTNSSKLDYTVSLSLEIDDPADEVNYYRLPDIQPQISDFFVSGSPPDTDTIRGPAIRIAVHSFVAEDVSNDGSAIYHFEAPDFLISDKQFNGQRKRFDFSFKFFLFKDIELLNEIHISLKTLSEEYYLYHTSLIRQRAVENDPFAEPVLLFNNINNGVGNFSGYSTRVDTIRF